MSNLIQPNLNIEVPSMTTDRTEVSMPNELAREQVEEWRVSCERLKSVRQGVHIDSLVFHQMVILAERYFSLVDSMATISAICGTYVEDASMVPSGEIVNAVARLQARAVKAERQAKAMLDALPAERAERFAGVPIIYYLPDVRDALRNYASAARGQK